MSRLESLVGPSAPTWAFGGAPIVTLPIPIFAALVGLYVTVASKWKEDRQRAYFLSNISSALMTLVSLPFVYIYLQGGLPAVWEAGQSGWTKILAEGTVAFFATYLFADLLVGYIDYRSQVGMLTGWIHHTVYIGIMLHLASTKQSCIFLTGAIMELPTFDLGISTIFPAIRSDERFLTLMLLTRIIFNAVLVVDCARPSSRAMMDGSWVPAAILGLALMLHASWMHGGVTGYLKRRAKARAAASAVEKPVAAPADLALDPLSSTDGQTTPEYMDAEGDTHTPEESPLVTPYTPSQPSVTIRDGLFPTITMPTMANLPIPNIPNLGGMAAALPQAKANLNQLNFGLKGAKDAVKGRWEEQRERFGRIRLRGGWRFGEYVEDVEDEVVE